MTDDEAREVYEKTKTQKSIACGSFHDCYKIKHEKLKHSLAVLIMTTGYTPQKIKSTLALNKRIQRATNYVLSRGILTPEIHYSDIIDEKLVTIKEFVEGPPLYYRGTAAYDQRVVENFCRQNGMPMLGKAEDTGYIAGLIESYNNMSAYDVAESEQEFFDNFYQEVLTTKKCKIEIDLNPDNYIKISKGLCIIDPVDCDFDGTEVPITNAMLDETHTQVSHILVPPTVYCSGKDTDLVNDIRQIRHKCNIASERLRANV